MAEERYLFNRKLKLVSFSLMMGRDPVLENEKTGLPFVKSM